MGGEVGIAKGRDRAWGGEVGMDQAYVQGLRDAKALLDEGIFTEQEFMREKETLLKQREERVAERQRLGAGLALPGVRGRKREDAKGAGAKPSKWAKYRKKCQHGKDAYECRACGGKRMCEHNKRRTRCPECSGPKSLDPAAGQPVGVPALGGPAQPPPPPSDDARPSIPGAAPQGQGAHAK